MNTQIELVQEPVIKHQLKIVGKNVTSRIDELNVGNLVAADDTIQSLKSLRADLNKELKEFENQRKALKSAIAQPYSDFETVYKTEVSEKYKAAIDILKDKIGEFEIKVKDKKQADIERYFAELCANEKIDFLAFKDTGISINLSTSVKKYKDECNAFVSRVADDLLLIQGQEYAPEIITVYKSNGYNASKAITEVLQRKEQEKLEAERIKQAETDRRTKMLQALAMVYHQLTRSYNWVQDDNIYIELKDIESLSKEDFQKRYVEIEAQIKERTSTKPEPVPEKPTPAPAPKPTAAPLQAPSVEKKENAPEKTFKASFECTGTMAQLKALGQYMKENNITYKNL